MFRYLRQKNYDDALREIQSMLSKGVSLNELQAGSSHGATKNVVVVKKEVQSIQTTGIRAASNNIVVVKTEDQPIQASYFLRRRHDVQKWLHKYSEEEGKKPTTSFSLVDVVENSVGGENVILRQSYHVWNYEIMVKLIFPFP